LPWRPSACRGAATRSAIPRPTHPPIGRCSSRHDPPDYGSLSATLAECRELDLNVAAAMLRHGNYDYFGQTIVWDPSIAQPD
jgi:hypothetical protein